MSNSKPTPTIDSITQGSSDDTLTVAYESLLQSSDYFNGGAGTNTIEIGADYDWAFKLIDLSIVMTDTTHGFHNYSRITFDPNAGYSILVLDGEQIGTGLISLTTTVVGNSYGSQQLIINNAHNVNISGWTFTNWSGPVMAYDTTGNDTFTGTTSVLNRVDMSSGGEDTFNGAPDNQTALTGRDILDMGAALDPGDRLNGGGGAADFAAAIHDDLIIGGDYSTGLTLQAATITGFAHIAMRGDYDYNLTMNDANVAAGQNFSFGAQKVNSITIDGSAETDGTYEFHLSDSGLSNVSGGAGRDSFYDGDANGVYQGGGDRDFFYMAGGNDKFVYASAAESSGPYQDIIIGFDGALDTFDVPTAVTAINTPLVTGALSGGVNFDTGMATAMTGLFAGHAVLFTPSTGNLAGYTFLVVDQNGVAGYQSGADLVIRLDGGTHLDQIAVGSFS